MSLLSILILFALFFSKEAAGKAFEAGSHQYEESTIIITAEADAYVIYDEYNEYWNDQNFGNEFRSGSRKFYKQY